jgi:hypothetical protein
MLHRISLLALTTVSAASAAVPACYKDVLPLLQRERCRYDFNWQLVYVLDKPLVLPKGSRIECTPHFDNSSNNPFNPDHKAVVHFDDQTRDKMMIGFSHVTVPASADPKNLFCTRHAVGD